MLHGLQGRLPRSPVAGVFPIWSRARPERDLPSSPASFRAHSDAGMTSKGREGKLLSAREVYGVAS
jgi:hypothetical protein